MLLLVERDQNSSLDKRKASFKELMGFFVHATAFEATDEKLTIAGGYCTATTKQYTEGCWAKTENPNMDLHTNYGHPMKA